MAIDRYRAAFAREAVHRLAEQDMCRVHSLTLDGQVIACLIVFVEAGVAYTWKTAYDEALSAFSPGTLLMIEVTQAASRRPQHRRHRFLRGARPSGDVSRLWTERKPIGTHRDRHDAGRRPRDAPGRLAAAPLPRDPQHGAPAAQPGQGPAEASLAPAPLRLNRNGALSHC